MAHRVIRWSSSEEKARWLDGAARLDSLTVPVRRFAARFVAAYKHAADRARAIQRWVRDHVRYTKDAPRMAGAMGEEFASSEDILRRLTDDCDGKSRLFVALCLAAGLEARIRPVFKGPHFVHVQGEVRWPGSSAEPQAMPGGWMLAELIVRGVNLGDDPTKVRHRVIV